MVRSTTLSCGLGLATVLASGFLPLVTAVPATAAGSAAVAPNTEPAAVVGGERFSFAKWVDDIIANPDTALTPEQAVQAFKDTFNGTVSDDLQKRWDAAVVCNPTALPSAIVSSYLYSSFTIGLDTSPYLSGRGTNLTLI